VTFTEIVADSRGREFIARACGSSGADGLWQGWLEFTQVGADAVLRSGRETTQPNRVDLEYWATGLTPVYLEGALERSQSPRIVPGRAPDPVPAYDGPAPNFLAESAANGSVLNPFSVYRKGEALLRRQLTAFSGWHLINIIRDYGLSAQTDQELGALNDAELIELIVSAVRLQADTPASR
jgi:hypothetical protein